MRIDYLFMTLVAVMMLGGCGGGMNSSNPDAPKANQAHEATWVTYHRNSLLDFSDPRVKQSNGELIMDGVIFNEHANQCRVCHGQNLIGPREGAKGSDCLSCHILDPVKYPVMCYSCHGGWPIVPFAQYTSASFRNQLRDGGWPVQPLQEWFSTARARRGEVPLDQNFVLRVRNSNIHSKHDAVPALPYDATPYGNKLVRNEECRTCHGYFNEDNLGARHHLRLAVRAGQPFVFNSNNGPVTVTLSCGFAPITTGGCHVNVFPMEPLDCLGCHAIPVTAHHQN